MPPKKEGPSKKTEQKKQAKVVEDKTFGLKNKNKSKTVQQFVKAVSNQVQNQGKGTMEKIMAEEFEKRKAQKAEEERKALMASIFKSVDTVKVISKVVDGEEQTIKLCQFFKQGLCNKGKKCKLSHDVGKDSQKIDIYTDQRSQFEEEEEGEIDSDKLQEIIKQKEGQYKKQCATEIVCKYFLDAVEKGKYGWKWMCPNGGYDCHYRHCLPPGFVLKKDMKKEEEQKSKIEDLIDEQREGYVRSTGTPVTLERFLEWKKKRAEKKALEEEKKKEELAKKNKGQKKLAGLTGRALFVFDPTLFQDDADAADEDIMDNRENLDEEQQQEEEDEEETAKEQRRLLEEQENQPVEEEEEEQEEEEQKDDKEEPKVEEKKDDKEKKVVDAKYIHIDEADQFF